MKKYKLICQDENSKIIEELLISNNIIIDQDSNFVICQDGICYDGDYDVLIYFKNEKISQINKITER